jgi:hypothetical protein
LGDVYSQKWVICTIKSGCFAQSKVGDLYKKMGDLYHQKAIICINENFMAFQTTKSLKPSQPELSISPPKHFENKTKPKRNPKATRSQSDFIPLP